MEDEMPTNEQYRDVLRMAQKEVVRDLLEEIEEKDLTREEIIALIKAKTKELSAAPTKPL